MRVADAGTSTPTPTSTSTTTPTDTLTATPTATPTATTTPTNTPTPTATNQPGYNFESDTENWTTSEGAFKLATLDTTTQFVYSGAQALRLTTQLRISSSKEVLRHTEAVALYYCVPIIEPYRFIALR